MRPDAASLPLLRALHERVFASARVRPTLDAAFAELAEELRGRPSPPHATRVVPVELFTHGLTPDLAGRVRLCRTFLLRRGARMAVPEAHRNSVQRLVSYRGRGRIWQGAPTGPAIGAVAPGDLEPRRIRSPRRDDLRREPSGGGEATGGRAPSGGRVLPGGRAPIERSWDIVPAGVWHYPEADGDRDWATVTFHGASEEEIVDELWEHG